MPGRRLHSLQAALLVKAKEAALNAVQTFNNPLTQFKSESFIVLMIISWTYLLHAYCREQGIEHRYHKQQGKRRIFDRTKTGAYKFWELERCLNDDTCPLDSSTKANLRFLIGIRHEIEHQMSKDIDTVLSSRYLACCLNFEYWITTLFGDQHSVRNHLSITLQFAELTVPTTVDSVASAVSANVLQFISNFEDTMSDDEINSPRYAYKLLFTRRLTSKRGQMDKVIEFIPPDSPLAAEIDKQYWVQKPVEKQKYLAKGIVKRMQAEGYAKFNVHHHTNLWKSCDAKNPAKGYGIQIESTWYWYDLWLDFVRKHCRDNATLYSASV